MYSQLVYDNGFFFRVFVFSLRRFDLCTEIAEVECCTEVFFFVNSSVSSLLYGDAMLFKARGHPITSFL